MKNECIICNKNTKNCIEIHIKDDEYDVQADIPICNGHSNEDAISAVKKLMASIDCEIIEDSV